MSAEGIAIALACSYCHGAATRLEAAFCAACLAPHHEDCFAEHGRCATLGCLEDRVVRPAAAGLRVVARPRRAWSSRWTAIGLGFLGLWVLGVVLIRHYVAKLQANHNSGLSLSVAFVAARDLEPGTLLTEADVSTADFPGSATERMFGDSRIMDRHTILGARTTSRLAAGQVFTRHHFAWPRACAHPHGGCR